MNKPVQPHLLLVEDEGTLGHLLKENLKLADFTVKLCKDGEEGWHAFQTERFDLCIFDINMPKMNGFELAEKVREKNQHTPILFLTANSTEEDKLKGFEIGADEYITKPFSTQELIARIRAILKRYTFKTETVLAAKEEMMSVGKTTIDLTNNLLTIDNEKKKISNTEGELLKIFIKNKNQLVPRSNILLHVWGRDDFYTARNLDVYINKIRKLLREDTSVEITNVHGSGFKLTENA